ncbi:MAG: response regulator [Pseudomonadota bacterium]
MSDGIKRILIIDDSADDRFLTRKILEKKGYTVYESSDWRDALKSLVKVSVDLVLLDMRMPEMDGLELLGIIRKNKTNMELPIIVYTSSTAYSSMECFQSGSNAFISKYNDPKILLNKIEEMLSTNP